TGLRDPRRHRGRGRAAGRGRRAAARAPRRHGPRPVGGRSLPPRGRRRGDRLPAAGRGARAVTDLLLGIDVGTSACKAAVVDAGGAERAHGQAPTPWRKVPTGAEIDPRALLDAALEAAAAPLAAAPPGTLRAGGGTGL